MLGLTLSNGGGGGWMGGPELMILRFSKEKSILRCVVVTYQYFGFIVIFFLHILQRLFCPEEGTYSTPPTPKTPYSHAIAVLKYHNNFCLIMRWGNMRLG